MDTRDTIVAWLNDAYALENQLVQVLEHQVNDTRDYPQIQVRIEQHLDATKRHAEMVKECVERLGGSTSALKSGMANLMGVMQGWSTHAAQDELVKNALADFAAENLEIASYTALIAAAEQIGDMQTVTMCKQIRQDEEEMASWLQQNLPMVVRESMRQVVGV